MRSNLRTFAVHSYEDWNAIFARLETEFISIDIQLLTERIEIECLHKMDLQ